MKVYKFNNTIQVIVLLLIITSAFCIKYFYFKNNYLYVFLCIVSFSCFIYSFIGNFLSYTAITNDSLILKGPHKKTVIEFRKMRYIYRSSNTKSIIIPVSLQFSDGHSKIALTSLSQNYKELIQSVVSRSRELSGDCQIESEVDMLLNEWIQ